MSGGRGLGGAVEGGDGEVGALGLVHLEVRHTVEEPDHPRLLRRRAPRGCPTAASCLHDYPPQGKSSAGSKSGALKFFEFQGF